MRAPGRCGTNSTACTITRARATARAAERRRRNRKDHVLPNRTGWLPLLAAFVGVAGVTVLLVALLTNIFERKQPGAGLQCHASNLPLYRFARQGDVTKGFVLVSGMPYQEARNMKDDKGQPLIQHSVACLDCHDPKTMTLRVTRPAFIAGIKVLRAAQGIADFEPNRDATRQEMRSFVCGQCHVEYYFKGDAKTVTYPWANGVRVEEIEAYYEKE